MLKKVCDLLHEAGREKRAVVAFDVFSLESILWAIEAAEIERSPVILMYYPGMMDARIFADIAKPEAEGAKVPVGLILDHGRDFGTAMGAIRAGMPSVMIDGSALGFEENVELTKAVVRVAHAMGIDVEGELGHVGLTSQTELFTNADTFTDAGKAAEFALATGVDALAVAIGNAHGNYPFEPKLDMQRLKEINAAVGIPLVLHGGTGIPAAQVREAIGLGVSKVNVGTSYGAAFYDAFKKVVDEKLAPPNYVPALKPMKAEVLKFLRGWLALVRG
jgi:fructose-bisphosphate aldolase class II/tagatose 1,6-diphosphate aldolase GatY/KbaY